MLMLNSDADDADADDADADDADADADTDANADADAGGNHRGVRALCHVTHAPSCRTSTAPQLRFNERATRAAAGTSGCSCGWPAFTCAFVFTWFV